MLGQENELTEESKAEESKKDDQNNHYFYFNAYELASLSDDEVAKAIGITIDLNKHENLCY